MFKPLKNRLASSALWIVILLCSIISVNGQFIGLPSNAVDTGFGGGHAILGTVLGPEGQRIETRVQVRISSMTKGERTANSDEKGTFAFRGIPSGSYTLVVDKEKDFVPMTQQVEIFERGPSQVYNVNVRLKYKPNTEPKPAVVNADFAGVSPKALESYNKAIELSKKGDPKEAIKELQVAVAEYSDFMFAYNEIGVQYLKLNDLDKADEAFQSALKIKPDSFSPMMNRGIVLVTKKQFQDAEPLLRKVIKLNEKSPVAHYFLGQALANLGKFEEAEKELLTAIEMGGAEMKEAHRLLAIIFSVKGDMKRAANELKTYLQLAPNTPDAEQLRKAITQFENSAEKPKPNN